MRESSSEAIVSYFDELLSEAPQSPHQPAVGTPSVKTAAPEVKPLATAPEPMAAVTTMDAQLRVLEANKKQQLQALLNSHLLRTPNPASATVEIPTATTEVEPIVELPTPEVAEGAVGNIRAEFLAWAENGRPVWAQKEFDVLLFKVAGLTLAVPLIALGHIHRLTDQLAPVFGQSAWFMGLQPSAWGSIRTVNTALLVMPERYQPSFAENAKYIITIDGLDWGLAVDAVDTLARLGPEDVTWRNQRSKRPWLAGTVKSQMCALIDIPQMGQLLQGHDRKRRPQ